MKNHGNLFKYVERNHESLLITDEVISILTRFPLKFKVFTQTLFKY